MYSTFNDSTYKQTAESGKTHPGSLFSRVPRAQWTMELDYCFVHTLAQYTICNSVDGLVLKNKYIDPAIIRYVESALKTNIDLHDLEMDLSVRYPNKKKEHRSLEALQLLVELKSTTPSYSHQQLNHKHINMWTRSIVPFRHLHESGSLFKGKTIFHKDCKRFVKVIMEVLSFAVYRGSMATLSSIFGKKPGQGSKLLEQWLNAMFEIHSNNMLSFMFTCAAKLARTFIDTKPAEKRTPDDIFILNEDQPDGKVLLGSLKEYLAKITEYESLDSMVVPFVGTMGPGMPMGAPAPSMAMDPLSNRPTVPYQAPPAMAPSVSSTSNMGMYSPVASASQGPPGTTLTFSSASNSGRGTPEQQQQQGPASRPYPSYPPAQSTVPNSDVSATSQAPVTRNVYASAATAANSSNYMQSRPVEGGHHQSQLRPSTPSIHQAETTPLQRYQQEQRQMPQPEWQRLPPPSSLVYNPRPNRSVALPPMTTGNSRQAPYSHHRNPPQHQQHPAYQPQPQLQLQPQRYKPYHHHGHTASASAAAPTSEQPRYQSGAYGYREHAQYPRQSQPMVYSPTLQHHHHQHHRPARINTSSSLPPLLSRPPPNTSNNNNNNNNNNMPPEPRKDQDGSDAQPRQAITTPVTIDSVFK